ncbi:MAG: hypothetical protein HY457_02925 [Parcubacteria group bacterium]|nr:hypothetical protein [Parcubacteria group bacterium]
MRKITPSKVLLLIAVFAVAFVYAVLPHLVRYETLKSEGLRYIPITLEPNFDHMNFGASRYRDVVDGNLFPGEMDTYEHKDGPILWPILVPLAVSPFFLPFESVFPGIVLTELVFPVLLFLALFFVLVRFTENKMFSLFSAYVLMLFPQLAVSIPPSSLGELKALFFQFIPFSGFSTSELNFLTRDSFIPGGPFFVMLFYSAYRVLTDENKKKLFMALGGIFYGLLFYLYFYYWVFATIFLGLLFLVLLATKNYSGARTIFFIGFAGIIVSIPFWINQYYLNALPAYEDIMSRMGIEEGHGVRWFLWKTYILLLSMAGLAIYFGTKFSKKILGYFLATLAVTGIIAYNINVVTGFTIQSDHWGNKVFLIINGMLLPPLLYYAWLSIAPYVKSKYAFNTAKVFSVIAVILVALLTTHVVESSVKENKKNALSYTVSGPVMDAYEWLTKNTTKDSVVMTPSIETNIELAGYTHNRVFQARAQNNLASKEEVLERMYITHTLFGVAAEKFSQVLNTHLGVFNFFTEEYNSRALDSHLRPERYPIYVLPKEVLYDLLQTYERYALPQKMPYRLDYIFVGPRERALSIDEEYLKRYAIVYDDKGVVIYKYEYE